MRFLFIIFSIIIFNIYSIYFETYFTKTTNGTIYGNDNSKIIDKLKEKIDNTKYTLDCHIYKLSFDKIINAFYSAADRGVKIRIITDADNWNSYTSNLNNYTNIRVIDDLKSAGPNLPSGRESHNKFFIFDYNKNSSVSNTIWTGSFNVGSKYFSTWVNYNPHVENVIVLRNKDLANLYLKEFKLMWGVDDLPTYEHDFNLDGGSVFGTNKIVDPLNSHIITNDFSKVEVYFGPTDNLEQEIIKIIKSANYNIFFCMNIFTLTSISSNLIEKFNQGISVSGVIFDTGIPYDNLTNKIGTKYIRHWGDLGHQLHDKYIIVDAGHTNSDPVIITGSANWTMSGSRNILAGGKNDENIIIFHNNNAAMKYYIDFKERIFLAGGVVKNPPLIESTGNLILKYFEPMFNQTNIKISYITPDNNFLKLEIYFTTNNDYSNLNLIYYDYNNIKNNSVDFIHNYNFIKNVRYYYIAYVYDINNNVSKTFSSILFFKSNIRGKISDNYLKNDSYKYIELYFEGFSPNVAYIYNFEGKLIKEINSIYKRKIVWNLKNFNGKRVKNGIYFFIYKLNNSIYKEKVIISIK